MEQCQNIQQTLRPPCFQPVFIFQTTDILLTMQPRLPLGENEKQKWYREILHMLQVSLLKHETMTQRLQVLTSRGEHVHTTDPFFLQGVESAGIPSLMDPTQKPKAHYLNRTVQNGINV